MRIKFCFICLILFCFVVVGYMDNSVDSIIVATYSVRAQPKDFSIKQRKLLNRYNVDIAALQVVDRFTYRNNYDMCEVFTKDPYQYSYFSKTMNYSGGEYGIMTISNIPLISREQGNIITYYNNEILNKQLINIMENYQYDDKELRKQRDALFDAGAVEPRIYQRVLINIKGKKIAFYNIHLSDENTELRLLQLKQMKQVLDDDPCPYKIMAGTFNTDQTTEELDLFLDDYQLANGQKGKWLNTYPLDDNDMRIYSIDNIICSNNIQIDHVMMVPSNLSNHNPLIVKITFH